RGPPPREAARRPRAAPDHPDGARPRLHARRRGNGPMKRPGWIWLAFGLCVALAALAMTRVGAMALELERAEAPARRQSALDENVQLALWRMDSALAPLIAEEGMRPYFTYNAFYPAERAYTHMFEMLKKGDVLVASPLLTYASPRIRLHFQFGPDGRLGSPQ